MKKDALSKPITKYECLNCGHRETQYISEYKGIVVCPDCHCGALVDSYKRDLYINHPEQSFGKGNGCTSYKQFNKQVPTIENTVVELVIGDLSNPPKLIINGVDSSLGIVSIDYRYLTNDGDGNGVHYYIVKYYIQHTLHTLHAEYNESTKEIRYESKYESLIKAEGSE